jgi:hypothetical protein
MIPIGRWEHHTDWCRLWRRGPGTGRTRLCAPNLAMLYPGLDAVSSKSAGNVADIREVGFMGPAGAAHRGRGVHRPRGQGGGSRSMLRERSSPVWQRIGEGWSRQRKRPCIGGTRVLAPGR